MEREGEKRETGLLRIKVQQLQIENSVSRIILCVDPADGICPGRAAAAGINNKATRCDYMAY